MLIYSRFIFHYLIHLAADKLRQQIIGQLYDHPLFNSEDNLLDTILRLQASESKEVINY